MHPPSSVTYGDTFPLEGEGFRWFCKLYKKCFELYILQNKFSGTYFPQKTNSDENVTHQSLPLRGGRWRRRRRMRADREDIPRFKVLFALFAHRKEGFPSGGKLSRKRLMRGDQSALFIEIIFQPKRNDTRVVPAI